MLDFLKPVTITYGITVCNEDKELKVLLDVLIPLVDSNDEIIVLRDMTTPHENVGKVLEDYQSKIKVIESELNGDFASFKNNLIMNAKCKFLFQIDADEYPTKDLIKKLKPFLRKQKKIECFFVPRINIVEGITEKYIGEMNWTVNDKGYINFPDYQARIIKNNKKIFWKNKVHEVFYGNANDMRLPEDFSLSLIHKKTFEKQQKQNEFYETLD